MRWLAALLFAQTVFAQLTVRVIEQGPDTPLEDANVELRLVAGLGGVRYTGRPIPPGLTGQSGMCQFPGLLPGYYSVKITRTGYADAENPQSRTVDFNLPIETQRTITIEARMVPTGTVHGTVYSEDGKPVARAPMKLLLMYPVEPGRRAQAILLRTDDNGAFSADDVPPGRYGLWIAPPDRLRAAGRQTNPETGEEIGYPVMVYHTGVEEEHWVEPIEVWPGAQLRNRVVVIRRMRTFSVRGRLIDAETKQPLISGRVALRTGDGLHEDVISQRMVHPQTGAFVLSGLSPGDYELLVYRPSIGTSLPWVVPVTVERGRGVADLALSVPAWLDISGEFQVYKRRIRGKITVALEPEVPGDGAVPGVSDADGTFQIRQIPPGRYTLRVQDLRNCHPVVAKIGGVDALDENFLLLPQSATYMTVTLGCGIGAVEGRVVDAAGEGLTRAFVVLATAYPEWMKHPGAIRVSRTRAGGEFLFPDVPDGYYRLVALKSRPRLSERTDEFWREYGPGAVRVRVFHEKVETVVLRAGPIAAK
ncbi:MAG TPA: hypothetical protein PKJ41_08660 [Bryobacteraceae bacterium]|nr:hypothetical protein [Bryobacteraceae bacterium]